MHFAIDNEVDVFKFALPLYEYLSWNGNVNEASDLNELVDACFDSNAEAREAHLKAYRQISENVHDLPPEYVQALNDALGILSGE